MSKNVSLRTTCRCCGSKDLVPSIILSPVPIISPNFTVDKTQTDEDLNGKVAPLDNYLCKKCGLNQLVHVVDPKLIYKNYLYETNISLGLDEHFKAVQELITKKLDLKPGSKIVEFGSNDGTLLKCFKNIGMDVHGVDPAEKAGDTARKAGIPTITDFFSNKLANQLKKDFGQAQVIISNNTMANIDDLEDIFTGIRDLLADDGVFVFETQYALDVLQKNLLDVIYHEHLTYFSVKPLVESLGQYGLQLFAADCIPTKGGSIRFWIQKANGPHKVEASIPELLKREEEGGMYDLPTHKAFENRVNDIKARIQKIIADVKASGGKVAAYGTSVGSVALIHQFELQDKLDYIFDDKPTKPVMEGPGYALPVHGPDKVKELQPAVTIVLAWRYAEVIAKKHPGYFAAGGKFFVPLPDGHYL